MQIIDAQWRWIFDRYDHIKMDAYVIMPDHFHGLIRIFPENKMNLSHIIGTFKTTSSKMIHQAGYMDYKWKRSFHDRILRNDELRIIRDYIKENPKNWNK